jgi:hypothetical protein
VRLETYPLIVAIVLGLVGLALIYDGKTPDYKFLPRERRRSPRIERDRRGEIILGIGVLALAASVAGRDVWRYRILAALIGGALIAYGTIRNRDFIGAMISDRGALRRRERPLDPLPRGRSGSGGSLATARPRDSGDASEAKPRADRGEAPGAPGSGSAAEPGAGPPSPPSSPSAGVRSDASDESEDPPPPIPS